MKANFVCFKLSKTVLILILVILLQIICIGIGIKEILETSNLEEMQNEVGRIEQIENKQDTYNNNVNEKRN